MSYTWLYKLSIKTKFIRGLRVTDKSIINIVESVLIDFNEDIVSSLEKKSSRALSINTKKNNIITVVPESKELGFVGIPSKINIEVVKSAIKKKYNSNYFSFGSWSW